jgi:hypothetical protein
MNRWTGTAHLNNPELVTTSGGTHLPDADRRQVGRQGRRPGCLETPVRAVGERAVAPAEPSDEQLDRLVEPIAELLSLRFAAQLQEQLVDAQAIATEFGVSQKWVYEHAEALERDSPGQRPQAPAALRSCCCSRADGDVGSRPKPAAPRRSRRGTSTPARADLLPISARRAAK